MSYPFNNDRQALLNNLRGSLNPNANSSNGALPAPTPNYHSMPSFSHTVRPEDMDDPDGPSDDEDDESRYPISINISVPLNITGDQNTISVDPAANGGALANSVVHAVRELTMCRNGVPVVDENGRPRSIKIHVEAAVNVQGTGNLVGQKAVEVGKVGPESQWVAAARALQRSQPQAKPPQTMAPEHMNLDAAARQAMMQKRMAAAKENAETEKDEKPEGAQDSNKRPRTE